MYLFTFFISAEALRMFQSISNQLTDCATGFSSMRRARRVWNIWPGQIYLCLMLMWENSQHTSCSLDRPLSSEKIDLRSSIVRLPKILR
jgi:hypothetical protein